MDDEEHELRKKKYDRSITEGVLPYDVNIDAYPVEDKPTPERHAYITWARLLQHGFTENCPGCTHGHHRHSRACRARFDAQFPRRRSGDGQEVEPEVESGQRAIEDADDCSYAPTTPSVSGETEVPECPPEKYVNIPSGKYIYVHKYVYICVYTYLCKMDENRSYAGLS